VHGAEEPQRQRGVERVAGVGAEHGRADPARGDVGRDAVEQPGVERRAEVGAGLALPVEVLVERQDAGRGHAPILSHQAAAWAVAGRER
jgi:hypothetical protein